MICFARQTDLGLQCASRIFTTNHKNFGAPVLPNIHPALMKVPKKRQKNSKRGPRETTTAPPQQARVVYSFGPFRLNEAERLVLRNGQPVPLTPKVFDILLLLVKSAGHLVSKNRLLNETWPEVFVDEANISVNISTLRRALGENPGEHQYIETVSKCGYRFVAHVTENAEKMIQFEAPSQRQVASEAEKSGARVKHLGFYSLAVLPFNNERADPRVQYLANGLAESVIRNLSQLRNLRVVAHNTMFRYQGKEIDPQVLGKELGVDSVLAGRILQLDDQLIVKTELIDVINGWQIWGGHYHKSLSDILEVEAEISEEISVQLKLRLTGEEKRNLYRRHTESAEAYRLYLKGRYHWNKFDQDGLKHAINYFTQAIRIDPAYPLAYAGLADSYYRLSNVYAPTREAMPKAKEAAIKALEIDETLSETHAALGLIKLCYEWDWSGAESAFLRAIEINPNYAVAHQRLGLYFNLRGRFVEATEELDLALTIDPLSLQTYWGFALSYLLMKDYGRAVEEIQKALEMDSGYKPALYLLGRIYEAMGELELAMNVFKTTAASNDSPVFLAALGHAYALAHMRRDARRTLNALDKLSKAQYVSPYGIAVIHLALGEKEQCFSYLEQAYENRCEMMTWLKIDPAFDSVRTDSRFANLLQRVGLGGGHEVR
jgi:TolB-like protein/Tfp pilus assembly protein PilF